MIDNESFAGAIQINDISTLRELIDCGLDPAKPDEFGDFALIVAAGALKLELVQELVKAGYDVNISDNTGYTPLLSVIEYSHIKPDVAYAITKVLLDAGADIEGRGDWDKTPFLKSCTRGVKKLTNLLVERGCDVHATADELGGPMGAEEFADMPSNSREFRKYISELCNS